MAYHQNLETCAKFRSFLHSSRQNNDLAMTIRGLFHNATLGHLDPGSKRSCCDSCNRCHPLGGCLAVTTTQRVLPWCVSLQHAILACDNAVAARFCLVAPLFRRTKNCFVHLSTVTYKRLIQNLVVKAYFCGK